MRTHVTSLTARRKQDSQCALLSNY